MHRKVKIFFISIAIIILLPVILYLILVLATLFFPDKPYHVSKNYRELPTEELIKKTRAYNILWRDTAMEALAERKEDKAVYRFIELLNSPIKSVRRRAMLSLGKIDDDRAIEPLMKIVSKGRDNIDYLKALGALSKLHCIQIYPEILNMVGDNFHTSYAVDMLEEFSGDPRTLLTLQKIAKEDPKEYIRQKAKNAIERIKRDKF